MAWAPDFESTPFATFRRRAAGAASPHQTEIGSSRRPRGAPSTRSPPVFCRAHLFQGHRGPPQPATHKALVTFPPCCGRSAVARAGVERRFASPKGSAPRASTRRPTSPSPCGRLALLTGVGVRRGFRFRPSTLPCGIVVRSPVQSRRWYFLDWRPNRDRNSSMAARSSCTSPTMSTLYSIRDAFCAYASAASARRRSIFGVGTCA